MMKKSHQYLYSSELNLIIICILQYNIEKGCFLIEILTHQSNTDIKVIKLHM